MRLPVVVLAACAGLAVVGPSAAAEAPKPVVARVDLEKTGLPIVWRGRLVNYVFVAVRLQLAPGRDGQALGAKEPYFRDALVRLGHRTPFVDPADLSRVDVGALVAAFAPVAARIAGPGAVRSVEVVSQQPRRRLPRPAAAPAAGRPITP